MQRAMPANSVNAALPGLHAFVSLVGERRWLSRVTEIRDLAASGPRAGQAIRQRHGIELSLEKLRRQSAPKPSPTDLLLGRIAAEIPEIMAEVTTRGQDR